MRIASAYLVGVAAMIGSLSGCKSSVEKQLEREQYSIAGPLEHDPTQQVELARWWSNGEQLLRLDRNAAYVMYEGVNRYAAPIERGRWAKQSYALVWLEPYNTINVEPRRVTLTRVNGRLALEVPKLKPMFSLEDGPPKVMEDRMVGDWTGRIGTLQLFDSLRYEWQASSEAAGLLPDVPRVNTYARGTWKVEDKTLVLTPDVHGVAPLRWSLNVHERSITIEAPGGPMTQQAPSAALEEAAPPS